MSGHTFWHDPDARYPATLNLGMAEVVAERTGLTVVNDFRGRDLVMGGQGFPLTPLIDYLLFHHPDEDRVLVHLGGVATVQALPGRLGLRGVTGFQAAPCTLLLDGLMALLTGGRELCDAGGKHAVQGCCIEPLLERWLALPILHKKPPRYLSRQEFGEDFVRQAVQHAKQQSRNLHDVLCTANHFVARAILLSIKRILPEAPTRVLLSGGAVRNGLLWRLLEQGLDAVPLEKTDVHGIPVDARKAVAFAGLAALTMDGVPVNLPSATGAAGPRLLGSVTPGAAANWARCLAWMAAQVPPPAPAHAE
jgi:anhydro-N-acetylmuramic acid kinase